MPYPKPSPAARSSARSSCSRSIYVLLGVLWVFILNHKIHAGPQPVKMPEGHNAEGFIATAAGRIDHEASMSEAKDWRRQGDTVRG